LIRKLNSSIAFDVVSAAFLAGKSLLPALKACGNLVEIHLILAYKTKQDGHFETVECAARIRIDGGP